jgi:predicted SAM-dependent methyltransferase
VPNVVSTQAGAKLSPLRKWRWLQAIPLVRHLKRARWKVRNAYFRLVGPHQLRRALRSGIAPRIVIGAQQKHDSGWIPTEKDFLDLLRPADWDQFFLPNSIAAILAEHVWEHLTPDEGLTAAKTCFTYLQPGGYLRCAVPDGFHPDPGYISLVKVEGQTPDDRGDVYPTEHKALYTYRTARELFERAGFQVELLEYFDEAGAFHAKEWSTERGTVWRSKRFDRRNQGGVLAYTSIILDAVKGTR